MKISKSYIIVGSLLIFIILVFAFRGEIAIALTGDYGSYARRVFELEDMLQKSLGKQELAKRVRAFVKENADVMSRIKASLAASTTPPFLYWVYSNRLAESVINIIKAIEGMDKEGQKIVSEVFLLF